MTDFAASVKILFQEFACTRNPVYLVFRIFRNYVAYIYNRYYLIINILDISVLILFLPKEKKKKYYIFN